MNLHDASPLIPNLRVPLTPSLVKPATAWASRFNDSALFIWSPVKVTGLELAINPYETSNFVRVAGSREASELDLRRLRMRIFWAIDEAKARAQSAMTRRALELNRELVAKAPLGEWNDRIPLGV